MTDDTETPADADDAPTEAEQADGGRWYSGISSYQWIVLIIASAGWVFDVYESQIFNITRGDMLAELIDEPDPELKAAQIKEAGEQFLAIFLAGGTFGGLLFGSLADRYGRQPIMIVTILMYSVFSGLNYFVTDLWQAAWLRFFVAVGIGGEWAVAAALVSEVFPAKARAQASAIFHASSILGTWLAAIVGILVATQWRYGYLVGVAPALLIVWVRASIKEPERWKAVRSSEQAALSGSFIDLLENPKWSRRAILGLLLAAVGLGTFWSVTVAGQGLAYNRLMADAELASTGDMSERALEQLKADASSTSKFAYGIVQAAGGGLGLLAFGPICARLGRKPTFILFQVAALIIVPIVCFLPNSYGQLFLLLPLFGFLTLGIHSGYAIYFPELFPNHLRATGTSFCFNGGRLAAVPILLYSGRLKATEGVSLENAVAGLSLLFLVGIVVVMFLPETKGQALPE